jgi:hypothetical protein
MRPTRLAPLAVLLVLAACQEEKKDPPATLSVTVDQTFIKADGTAVVTVHVSGARAAPITVTATRGTFSDTNDRQTQLSSLTGDAVLVTCDGHLPSCPGVVNVSATDATGIGGGTALRFIGFENCANGVDDNTNGLIDCADDDCVAGTCTTSAGAVGVCTSDVCVCNATSPNEAVCGDGSDDDCDGEVDCADPDCLNDACVVSGGSIGACSSGGSCVCTPTGATEGVCNDGRDNDCDGSVDCFDADCAAQACQSASGAGVCNASACVAQGCTKTEDPSEMSCGDGLDNDCDLAIDCDDSNCSGQQCGDSPAVVCISGACTDVSTGYALEVTPERTRLPADGTAQTEVALRVLHNGQPVPTAAIGVAASLGSLSAATVSTDVDGKASVTYTASATGGRATLTATLAEPPLVMTATIDLPVLGGIVAEGEGLKYRIMGVKGSGFNEQNVVTVRVLDTDEQPYPAGLAVRFEHRALAGSQLSQAPISDPPGGACAAPCMSYVGRTDDQGLVRVNLYSGTKAGTLGVEASSSAGGEQRYFALPNVAVIGARANAGAFTIDCDPKNVPGFQEHNCSVSLVEGQYSCVAALMDRFGNALGTETQVTFVSETSRTGQVTTTPPYVPFSSQPELGIAVQTFQTLGGYLPDDVAPRTGEASAAYADVCSDTPRTHNPRDGVVTVIAIADGEESFTDIDGDGVFDAGEPFVDLPEPFVDYDDDGQWTFGEYFLDVNGDGTWTAPNGVWNAYTKIWTQTAIVYTGDPETVSSTTGLLGTRWITAAEFNGACDPSPPAADFSVDAEYEMDDGAGGKITVPPTTASYFVVASDWNLNRLATAATYAVEVQEPAGVEVIYDGLPAYADGTGFFYQYWACDQLGNCANRCTATGAAGPCVMKARVSNFSCGIAAPVTIRGGTEPTGPEIVNFTATLDPEFLKLPLAGTNN